MTTTKHTPGPWCLVMDAWNAPLRALKEQFRVAIAKARGA